MGTSGADEKWTRNKEKERYVFSTPRPFNRMLSSECIRLKGLSMLKRHPSFCLFLVRFSSALLVSILYLYIYIYTEKSTLLVDLSKAVLLYLYALNANVIDAKHFHEQLS